MVPSTACRLLFKSDPLRPVWGHLFAKFMILTFSKDTAPRVFNQVQPIFISMLVMREYRLLLFWHSSKI